MGGLMARTMSAVLKCEVCGKLLKGVPVRVPDGDEITEEVLRLAMQGLAYASKDLTCPNCKSSLFTVGAKMRIVYEEGTAH